jgi:hypothetical protein
MTVLSTDLGMVASMRTPKRWMVEEPLDLDAASDWPELRGRPTKDEGEGDGSLFRSLLEATDVAPDSVWRR